MSLLALLQQAPEFDLRGLLEGFFKFLAFFVFLGLPILRSIVESRKKARERREQGATPGEAEEERRAAAAEARRRWVALLRGEDPEAAAPPGGAPSAPPPLPARAEARSEAEPAPPPLVAFDTRSAGEEELETEGAGDEERRAREELDRRLREERSQREVLTARPVREEGVTVAQVATPSKGYELAVEAPSVAETVQRRRHSRGGTGGGHRLGDLRRAVIASEILGPPVSQRGPGGARSLFDRDG